MQTLYYITIWYIQMYIDMLFLWRYNYSAYAYVNAKLHCPITWRLTSVFTHIDTVSKI